MSTKTFRYAAFALRILEKLLGSNFSVSGIENLPRQPIMFVANHFTRAETLRLRLVVPDVSRITVPLFRSN
jgi:1-acyl-sn-glycerol-3-phosphate acyltransferase